MANQGDQTPESDPSLPEILGSKHWSGLLDPLDPSLRGLILLCGDLCQVTYDSFNSDPHSKYTGSCRYSKSTLLQKVLFPLASDLTVSAYLYATSEVSELKEFLLFSKADDAWSKESNWIGYVAISNRSPTTGRRVIYVAWRGTIRTLEWVDVLEPRQVSIGTILSASSNKDISDDSKEELKVMDGWYTIYTSSNPDSPFSKYSARHQLLYAIKELIARYKDESELSIVCTGHSLGASLATLCAFDIVESGLAKIDEKTNIQVTAIVFGSPKVGNKEFKERLEMHQNLRVLRVKNEPDVIPLYPFGILGFVNVGEEFLINSKKSPYLKDSASRGDYHNLQGILHTVAGWNREKGEFKLQVKRSIALVNKSSEYLKDELLVPGSWWVEKNKGMVLGDDGEWRLEMPADEDLPVPPPEGEADMVPSFGGGGFEKNVDSKKEEKGESGPKLRRFVCCFGTFV